MGKGEFSESDVRIDMVPSMSELLELLKKIKISKFNQYRIKNPGLRVDLSKVDLTKLIIEHNRPDNKVEAQEYISKIRAQGIDLSGIYLTNADLTFTKFRKVNLTNANLSGCKSLWCRLH